MVFDGRWLPGRRFESEHPTVFFDGVCNLCNHTVDFIICEDRSERFKFAPVQGTTAEVIEAQEVRSGESMALMDGDTSYTKSDAVLMVAAGLGGIWRILFGVDLSLGILGMRFIFRSRKIDIPSSANRILADCLPRRNEHGFCLRLTIVAIEIVRQST